MAAFSELSGRIIGLAIEVHKALGPGLLESVYKRCLAREMELAGIPFEIEFDVPLEYKGLKFEWSYRADFLVARTLVVEVKAAEHLLSLYAAQTRTYLRLLELNEGLLFNFNVELLSRGGIKSVSPYNAEGASTRNGTKLFAERSNVRNTEKSSRFPQGKAF